MKRLSSSFYHAFCGIIKTFVSEPNFRIHSFFAVGVIVAGFVFGIKPYEWLAVVFATGLVMAMECVNTAVEKTVDMITPDYDERAKFIKDASAAGVLISAITAAVVGFIVFFKYIILIFIQEKL